MYKIKKLTALLLIVFCLSIIQVDAFAQFETAAGAAVLMEAASGQVLYEKDADTSLPPASITKLMTLVLAFDALESGKVKWDDLVTVSEKAWKTEGSRMFLEVGQKVTFGELVTGISVVSANDGCIAVAEHLYGSENAFVEMMNKRAAEIGLTKSHFENCMGLPSPGHRMSAGDIAILARFLIKKYPKILEIESTKELTFNNIHQYNRNPLLGVFPGADGLKTGWTEEAGYCLVGTAKQNDTRLIAVILNTKNDKERLTAAQELLNYGFKNFQVATVSKPGDILDEIAVINGKKPSVPLKIEKEISVIIPGDRKDDLKIVKTKENALNTPVKSGTKAGTMEVQLDGKTLASADLLTAEDAPRAGFFELLWRKIIQFIKSIF